MIAKIEISTERFVLRPLTVHDVTEIYLGWLSDFEVKKFITSAATFQNLSSLRQYVLDRIGREDILNLGIFDKTNGLHIGNIKYEPVNLVLGYAVMGVLIGDPAYRGKGVAAEALIASARWLKENRNTRQILLGVSKDNYMAIRTYHRVGFEVGETPYIQEEMPGDIKMIWQL